MQCNGTQSPFTSPLCCLFSSRFGQMPRTRVACRRFCCPNGYFRSREPHFSGCFLLPFVSHPSRVDLSLGERGGVRARFHSIDGNSDRSPLRRGLRPPRRPHSVPHGPRARPPRRCARPGPSALTPIVDDRSAPIDTQKKLVFTAQSPKQIRYYLKNVASPKVGCFKLLMLVY